MSNLYVFVCVERQGSFKNKQTHTHTHSISNYHRPRRGQHCFPYAHTRAGYACVYRAFTSKFYFLLVRLVASIRQRSQDLFKHVDRVTLGAILARASESMLRETDFDNIVLIPSRAIIKFIRRTGTHFSLFFQSEDNATFVIRPFIVLYTRL